jgi:TolB protein
MNGQPAEMFLTPAFSPDGKRIAVEAKSGKEIHIYTAFVSGGTPVRATSGELEFEAAPSWSPDGKWISFEHVAHSSLQLAKVRPGSGEPPVDLGAIASNPVPAWSPSGEWIAACNDKGAPTVFSPDGKPPRLLPGNDCGPFAWSRDGKTLYQVRFAPALFAIDIATGREQKLRDLADLEPFAGLNPGLRASLTSDGKNIVYTVDRLRVEIWILDGIQSPRTWYERLLGR